MQSRGLELPQYALDEVGGEPHEQWFVASCEVPALGLRSKGEGSSRRRAEQEAAQGVLAALAGPHRRRLNTESTCRPRAPDHHCAVALQRWSAGPNVGKSTLLNALLGQKVSIVTPKAQTTRTRVLGMLNQPGMQIIFVDLPGIHAREIRAMNRYMNRTALSSLADSDVNLFVIEALRWTDEDERALSELKAAGRPIILLINKVDRAHPKERLFPFIEDLTKKAEFVEVVPISATTQIEPGQAAGAHRAAPAGIAAAVSRRPGDRLGR